ncbi:MAG: 3-phosphoshikimate 1-carboxyvinyltransferase [Bacteroidales bacterium]
MAILQFNTSKKVLCGEINLPASKSISNRALILKHIAKDSFSILNQSLAEDSILLDKILNNSNLLKDNSATHEIFVDNAGTAMRFLTSLLSIKKGNWLLMGSDRMKERPIAGLVDALNQIGAVISYKENFGFPPLFIQGNNLKGGMLSIEANTSSQYITSILLIAAFLENGLGINLIGKTVSKPYIVMTLKILNYFGITYTQSENGIVIPHQVFCPKDIYIESDWSAASYWYEMASFADSVDLKLNGLTNSGWQGDAIIVELFNKLGVKTEFLNDGVRLTKTKIAAKTFSFDFSDFPDIAPSIAVCCAGLGIHAKLKGLEGLKIKESNRLSALERELNKINCHTIIDNDNTLLIVPSKIKANAPIFTYNDHRMAMSFAPLAIILGNLNIDNIDVVKKSYPGFWNDLQSVGFTLNY